MNVINNKKRILGYSTSLLSAALVILLISCDEFVQINPPRTTLVKSTVFENDATANAAMVNVYYNLKSHGFASGSPTSISFWGSYSSDEQVNYFQPYQSFNDNDLNPDNPEVLSLWSQLYKSIYDVNAILEGLDHSASVSEMVKGQLTGEAKFIRAFCYFYLANLFGGVPLVTTTDYRVNSRLTRSNESDVYAQIVNDLSDAYQSLPESYAFSNNERVRANKYAAAALLARTYLYMKDWTNAELSATAVIAKSQLYSLENLSEIFQTGSTEAILQWWSEFRPTDRATFRATSTPTYGAIRPAFFHSFEANDERRMWINLNSAGYYNVRKYNSANDNPALEYSTVLRLAEQHLIRAEARAQLDNYTGALEDINIIRNRAGLPASSVVGKAAILLAIENERKAEFVTEWGHRWFDLKRTDRADAVLAPLKGSTWQSTDILYPIPRIQLQNNPAMADEQNPGYQ